MPAHKVEIVFITVANRVAVNNPARAPTRFDPGQIKLSQVLPARRPAAVTELASLGGHRLLKHLPQQEQVVVPVETNYCCLGASIYEGQIGPNP